jgi:hypothetical protein
LIASTVSFDKGRYKDAIHGLCLGDPVRIKEGGEGKI